ncbi:probable acyl-[acyl-carrier-protein]--UDP-N-acetylglucosamine O-acyltransferase, mitochondrial isoform X3 [Selaginella moellendorffii]|nr:probable acyl-[acyl-carrier-protein]--UDP-N-acetylglucosamine O-acyltransferase, mitochondrial isoform X3 [Selaginella moellendorffii]|eukprot:XP_002974134.2 probable acyl-[acyl-carrier-protein]--UDP-N-acetylglucosamine O-acyltransferase, mitochondrial isoform X3 [Selaginella moellendorffii]
MLWIRRSSRRIRAQLLPFPLAPPAASTAFNSIAKRCRFEMIHSTSRDDLQNSGISSSEPSLLPSPGSSRVHPTAIVHSQATIGEYVSIGPFCSVGPGAKLGSGCTLHPNSHIFGNTHIGDNSTLFPGAIVGADIPGETVIGKNNSIGCYAVVGVKCQDLKYKDADECFLRIGDNNDIREHASVHRSSKSTDSTIIGDSNLIMGACHIAHDVKLGNSNILANGTLLGGHVVVENCIHTGGGAAVHQFCHIGSYSFLAGGSMVDRDVPMYMMVAGNRAELRGLNLEGLRRRGFSEIEVNSLRRAYQRLFVNSDENAGGIDDRLAILDLDAKLSKVEVVLQMIKSVRDCFGENRRGLCKFRQVTGIIDNAIDIP